MVGLVLGLSYLVYLTSPYRNLNSLPSNVRLTSVGPVYLNDEVRVIFQPLTPKSAEENILWPLGRPKPTGRPDEYILKLNKGLSENKAMLALGKNKLIRTDISTI